MESAVALGAQVSKLAMYDPTTMTSSPDGPGDNTSASSRSASR